MKYTYNYSPSFSGESLKSALQLLLLLTATNRDATIHECLQTEGAPALASELPDLLDVNDEAVLLG